MVAFKVYSEKNKKNTNFGFGLIYPQDVSLKWTVREGETRRLGNMVQVKSKVEK